MPATREAAASMLTCWYKTGFSLWVESVEAMMEEVDSSLVIRGDACFEFDG